MPILPKGSYLTSEDIARHFGLTVRRVNQIAQEKGLGRKLSPGGLKSQRLFTERDLTIIGNRRACDSVYSAEPVPLS